jgi:hypothetical protein
MTLELNDIKTLIHLFSLFEIGKMESRVSHFKSKIIRVLGNLLAGKCEVRIDECLNKFLEVLEQQESKGWCFNDRLGSIVIL